MEARWWQYATANYEVQTRRPTPRRTELVRKYGETIGTDETRSIRSSALVMPQRHFRRHAGLGIVLPKLNVEGSNPFARFASRLPNGSLLWPPSFTLAERRRKALTDRASGPAELPVCIIQSP